MTQSSVLTCPHCREPALPEDDFCEACGHSLTPEGGDHVEIDQGISAGVSDIGRLHSRNEDALSLPVQGSAAAVAVCDGVSLSTMPHLASRTAAHAATQCLEHALLARNGTWDAVAAMT